MAAVPIKKQGVLLLTETPIYKTPQGKRATISLIRYKNLEDLGYTVTLARKIDGNNNVLAYSITLDAGDFVDDKSDYRLNANDELVAKGSSSKINFIINGEEVDV